MGLLLAEPQEFCRRIALLSCFMGFGAMILRSVEVQDAIWGLGFRV